MRSAITLLTSRIPRLYPISALPVDQHVIPHASSSRTRSFSTTTPVLKKSKAAAVRRQHKEAKEQAIEETGENPEGKRYQQAGLVDLDDAVGKAKTKMQKTTEWAKALVYEGVERGKGRVSPAILDSVKVILPEDGASHPLTSFASVTVRQGALWVDVWDNAQTKHIESALSRANLPGLSPVRVDATTIKLPAPRPTHEQRQEIIRQLNSSVEQAKNAVRKARTEGMNALGGRSEPGSDEVEKLASEYGSALGELMDQAKKEFEKV